jgi:tRNA-specific adenosine deaminase 1
MELTIAAQEDDTPWALPLQPSETEPESGSSLATNVPLQGRAYFSHLGIVRRKPSRPDAPPTLSKSCSDKLSQKQVLSLLSSPLTLLISPENAYLSSLILPSSQYSPAACSRAFSPDGRMASLKPQTWESGYSFHPFEILTTEKEFRYSRRRTGAGSGLEVGKEVKFVPSNIATAWTPFGEETLIGGVLQGRKQFDPKGACMLSKKRMWKLAMEAAAVVGVPTVSGALSHDTYEELKESELLEGRRKVKREVRETALKGWVRNLGGEKFGLDRAESMNPE